MKGSKALRKAGEQEPKAGEFQGRAKGVVEREELHVAQGLTPKFMAKFAGPFPVVKHVFDDAYKLVLPPEIKLHPVFHVLLLKEYFEDSVRPEREQMLRPVPELVGNHEEYEVETILNKRKLRL